MLRVLTLTFGIIVALDFGWLFTHWSLHPDMTRHAEYLSALAVMLYAIDRTVTRVRRARRGKP